MECLDHLDRLAQDEVSGGRVCDWVLLRIPKVELALFGLVGAELREFVHRWVIFLILRHHEDLLLTLISLCVLNQLVEIRIDRVDCLLNAQLLVLRMHHFVALVGMIDLVPHSELHQKSRQVRAVRQILNLELLKMVEELNERVELVAPGRHQVSLAGFGSLLQLLLSDPNFVVKAGLHENVFQLVILFACIVLAFAVQGQCLHFGQAGSTRKFRRLILKLVNNRFLS